jgi:hypothetical protein
MKTLIENSIKIGGIGHPDTKTIFTSEDRNDSRFKSLTHISGRKLSVFFTYTEGEEEALVETTDRIQLTIPVSNDEQVIKDFIITEVNNKLNS